MFNWLKAQGPTFNAILITALAAIAGVVAFSFIGWLGVVMLGLADERKRDDLDLLTVLVEGVYKFIGRQSLSTKLLQHFCGDTAINIRA